MNWSNTAILFGTRFLVSNSSPDGVFSSESHKNVDAVDISESQAADKNKKNAFAALVSDTTSVVPFALIKSAGFLPDAKMADPAWQFQQDAELDEPLEEASNDAKNDSVQEVH